MPKKQKKKEKDIEVVIDNPECIPIAQERLIKFLYDQFIREASEEDYKKIAQ